MLALLFAAEALRRGGAKRLVLVAPYLCYMRQDTAFHPGEAISQKVIGALIARTVDRVITVDAHLHRTRNIADVFFGIEAQDLSAMPAMAEALRGIAPDTVVVGPDEESQGWVSDLAAQTRTRQPRSRARPGAAIARSKSPFPIPRCSRTGRCCWSTTSSLPAAR